MLSLVTAATAFPLTTDDVKEQLRIDSDDDAQLLNRLMWAATDYVDAQGVLGRALISQTWQQALQYPNGRVYLKLHPVSSLTAVKYYDTANDLQTDTLGNYRLITGEDWAYVEPTSGNAWPTTFDRPDAVQIQFVAGYGAAATDIPEGIRHALLLLIGHWYDNRESATGMNFADIPLGFDALLNNVRRSWYG